MTDKSADVRKAVEICFGEILKVCGHEMVTKNSRDIQGPALAIVLERLKPYGASHDTYESARTITTGPPSKGGSKIGKANGYAGVSKHGSRAVSSRVVSSKGSRPETIMVVQDITIQAQALLSIKDSNKDERERLVADASLMMLCLQSSDGDSLAHISAKKAAIASSIRAKFWDSRVALTPMTATLCSVYVLFEFCSIGNIRVIRLQLKEIL